MIKKINDEIKKAMLEKDASRRDVFFSVKSAANLMAKEAHKEVEDEHIISAIRKEVKALNGTLAALEGKDGVEEAVKDANYRISVLEVYLPKMLNHDEVLAVADPIVAAMENPNMGNAMKSVMAVLKGKADGKLIKEVVVEILKNQKSA